MKEKCDEALQAEIDEIEQLKAEAAHVNLGEQPRNTENSLSEQDRITLNVGGEFLFRRKMHMTHPASDLARQIAVTTCKNPITFQLTFQHPETVQGQLQSLHSELTERFEKLHGQMLTVLQGSEGGKECLVRMTKIADDLARSLEEKTSRD